MSGDLALQATVALMGFVFAGVIAGSQLWTFFRHRRRFGFRLEDWGAPESLRRQYRRGLFRDLGDRIDATAWGKKSRARLDQADLAIKPSEYLGVLVLLGIAIFAAIRLTLGLDPLLTLSFALLAIRYLPRFYLNSRRDHYVASLDAQMPELATLIGNSLRAGLSIQQAFEVVADKMPRPAGPEFRRIGRELKLGVGLERAVEGALERLPSEELRMMMTTVLIQRLAGGNLAQALEQIAEAVTARRRVKDEVRTMTSEVRFTSVILLALPALTLVMVNAILPGSVSRFLSHPIGWIVVAIYAVVQVFGFVLVRRIADVKV